MRKKLLKTIIACLAIYSLFACTGSRTRQSQDNLDLLSTESIRAPACTPARGITTIVINQQLIPEQIQRRAAVKDIRIVIDWMTRLKEGRLLLKMVSETYFKVKGAKAPLPVKHHVTISEISPDGKVLSLQIDPNPDGQSPGSDDPAKLDRLKKEATQFAGMFIPVFQTTVFHAGKVVASSVERFGSLVKDNRPVRIDYIYRGLSRLDNRMVIVVDYDELTKIGPFTILQKGYHLYDADRRYLVSSKGSARILQNGRHHYSVTLQADTVFSR